MDGLRFNTTQSSVDSLGNSKSSSQSLSLPKNPTAPGESFSDTLKNAIQNVNQLQKNADVKMQELALGKSQNIHETMIAAEKADIAMKLMVQVRNKIIDAYHEIMRMQV